MFITSKSGNGVINLDQCQFFRKTKEDEKPIILFAFTNYRLTWIYTDEEKRDSEYQELVDKVIKSNNDYCYTNYVKDNAVPAFYGELVGTVVVETENELPDPPSSDREFMIARVTSTRWEFIGPKGTWTKLDTEYSKGTGILYG